MSPGPLAQGSQNLSAPGCLPRCWSLPLLTEARWACVLQTLSFYYQRNHICPVGACGGSGSGGVTHDSMTAIPVAAAAAPLGRARPLTRLAGTPS